MSYPAFMLADARRLRALATSSADRQYWDLECHVWSSLILAGLVVGARE
ncbi:MAG: hypothetical protein KKD97_11500 [Gammaproteobacteria bacterium]|nr:hypothetical protein [Gammaproteobacteria bacterium]